MRESVLPEGVMDFLVSRRGWFWILSAAGALLLLFMLVTWLRFGLVRVHYTTGDHVGNGRIEARAYDIESNQVTDEDAFTTIFGLALVPRSTRYVRVTSGTAETIAPIAEVPWFGVGRFEAGLEAQRAVEKLGTDLAGCTFTSGEGTYNYDCVNPGAIFHYVRPDRGRWANEQVHALFPGQTTKGRPYADGLLGLTVRNGAQQTAQVFYAVPGQAAPQTMPVPADLLRGGAAYLNIETDGTDRSNRSFLLYNMFTGQVIRFSAFSATAARSEYNRDAPYERATDVTQCALQGQTVYCYTGLRGGSSESGDEDVARVDAKPAVIEVFGPGKNGSYTATQVFGLDRFYVTAGGEIFVRSVGRLYQVALVDGVMMPTQVSGGVSAVAAGRALYWTTLTGMYRYDPATRWTHLVFSAANLQMSDMSARGSELTFNTFVMDDQQSQLHTYRLGEAPLEGSRWEDRLPYSSEVGLPIISMDYTATRMYFRLRAATVTTPSGEVEVDRDPFDAARQAVLDQLAKDGFDPGRLAIDFTS
jgi:hypothetical protein